MKAKVLSRTDINSDLIKVTLLPEKEWAFQGGQYLMLGPNKDCDLKPFSIASGPERLPEIELHIRNTHGSTWIEELFKALKPESDVEINGPFDHLNNRLPQKEKHVILLAGGTGYAPMKSILGELLSNDQYGSVSLYWGAQSADELYEHDELTTLVQAESKFHYYGCVSGDTESTHWEGFTGYIHERVLMDFEDMSEIEILACGPKAMTEAALSSFTEQGLNPELFIS